LRRMLLTWSFAVFGLINICAPISLLPRPAAVPITGKTCNRGRHYVLGVGSDSRNPMAPRRGAHGSQSIDQEVRACSLCGRTTNPIPPTGQPSSRSRPPRRWRFRNICRFLEGGYGLLDRSALHVTFMVNDLYLSTPVRNSLAGLPTETPLARSPIPPLHCF
jgi:hypothetical protein